VGGLVRTVRALVALHRSLGNFTHIPMLKDSEFYISIRQRVKGENRCFVWGKPPCRARIKSQTGIVLKFDLSNSAYSFSAVSSTVDLSLLVHTSKSNPVFRPDNQHEEAENAQAKRNCGSWPN